MWCNDTRLNDIQHKGTQNPRVSILFSKNKLESLSTLTKIVNLTIF